MRPCRRSAATATSSCSRPGSCCPRPGRRPRRSPTRCSCSPSAAPRPTPGLVSFAGLTGVAVFALPAGVAADRWSRRRLMIAADAVRAAAVGALGLAVVAGDPPLAAIVAVGARRGGRDRVLLGGPGGSAALGRPGGQLQAAAGVQEARRAVVRVGGAAARRRPLRPRPRGAVPRRRRLLRLLDRLAARDADAVPGGSRARGRGAGSARRSPRASASSGATRSCARRRCSTRSATSSCPGVLLVLVVAGTEHGLTPAQIGGLTRAVQHRDARRLARLAARPARPAGAGDPPARALDGTCTSPRPTRPGSTKSNVGSDCSPTSGCAAALTPACRRWKKTSATGSQRGTRTQNPSPGPKPPTRYSNASPHIYSAFLAQDTRSVMV